jgi:hypothetical protein
VRRHSVIPWFRGPFWLAGAGGDGVDHVVHGGRCPLGNGGQAGHYRLVAVDRCRLGLLDLRGDLDDLRGGEIPAR